MLNLVNPNCITRRSSSGPSDMPNDRCDPFQLRYHYVLSNLATFPRRVAELSALVKRLKEAKNRDP
jgi:hypothetical protein